jgi:hypothetical protein
METFYFAVVPDQTGRAFAAFEDLEDAMAWGLLNFGSNGFAIRRFKIETHEPRHVRAWST